MSIMVYKNHVYIVILLVHVGKGDSFDTVVSSVGVVKVKVDTGATVLIVVVCGASGLRVHILLLGIEIKVHWLFAPTHGHPD